MALVVNRGRFQASQIANPAGSGEPWLRFNYQDEEVGLAIPQIRKAVAEGSITLDRQV